MLTALTDEKPPIAASGGGGDISVGACESAGCLDDHEGSCLSFVESVTHTKRARARPVIEGCVKPFRIKVFGAIGRPESCLPTVP